MPVETLNTQPKYQIQSADNSLNNGHERQEKHRAGVIDEIWVVNEGTVPHVYIPLLFKTTCGWWETAGGYIQGEQTEENVAATAIKERDEESPTVNKPLREQIIQITGNPMQLIDNDFLLSPEHQNTENEIVSQLVGSYPLIMRRFFKEVPKISLGKPEDPEERREHSDYRLVDVSNLYFQDSFEPGQRNVKHVLRNGKQSEPNCKQPGALVQFVRDPEYPQVLRFENPDDTFTNGSTRESLNLSSVCIANFLLYTQTLHMTERFLPVNQKGELQPDYLPHLFLNPVLGRVH